MLAVMALLSPVVFQYIDLLCDAELGGCKAVQRVLPGLLGCHSSVLHRRCLEGSPEKRRCCAEAHGVCNRHWTLLVEDHVWNKVVDDQVLAS